MSAADLKIASAYLDAEGWIFFDASGNPVTDWPSDWPAKVSRSFVRERGIEVAV